MQDEVPYDILLYRLEQAEQNIQALNTDLQTFKDREVAMEKKRLYYGVGLLGSIVMTLIGVIWAKLGVIIK